MVGIGCQVKPKLKLVGVVVVVVMVMAAKATTDGQGLTTLGRSTTSRSTVEVHGYVIMADESFQVEQQQLGLASGHNKKRNVKMYRS